MPEAERLMDEQCLFCQHFQADAEDADGIGQCRRYPPVWVADDEEAYCTFSIVAEDAFCGEFKRRAM